jgi:hypothetical protein
MSRFGNREESSAAEANVEASNADFVGEEKRKRGRKNVKLEYLPEDRAEFIKCIMEATRDPSITKIYNPFSKHYIAIGGKMYQRVAASLNIFKEDLESSPIIDPVANRLKVEDDSDKVICLNLIDSLRTELDKKYSGKRNEAIVIIKKLFRLIDK